MSGDSRERLALLVSSLGIDPDSFNAYLEWALSENLVANLSHDDDVLAILDEPDGLRRFRTLLKERTGRAWSRSDYVALFERLRTDRSVHVRTKLRYEDVLRLFAESPRACVQCGAEPPAVVLHIDHVLPVSRGGSAKRENLQFLCAPHNLQKSNKREMRPWLDLA